MKKKILIPVIILLVLIAAAATAYVVYAQKYNEVFYEGTKINGVDVGNRRVSYIADKLEKEVKSYSLTVSFRDGSTEILDFDTLGLIYDPKPEIQAIFDGQNKYEFYKRFTEGPQSYTVGTDYTCHKEKTDEAVAALPEMSDAADAPKDAYIQMTGNYFEIVPEEQGNSLNLETVQELVYEAVSQKETSLDLTDSKDAYKGPSVASDNADLNDELKRLNAIATTTVTYDMSDGETENVADSSIVLDCFIQDENGKYSLDNDKLTQKCRDFVTNMAASDDMTASTITWHSTNKGNYDYPCETYGHTIDVEAETAALVADFQNGKVEERAPAYSLYAEKPSAPTTYIEVDLDRQHVYFYIDGGVAIETDCVTGTANTENATPKGFYSIYFMQKERDLKGQPDETGAPSYISHVHYWMAFYKGYGLHDATWRSSFGGNIYTYGGSHGCVNLPLDIAAKIYEKATKGTPVMVV